MHRSGTDTISVVVSGLLVREHADRLDRDLADAFSGRWTWVVVDLRGVRQLDPTSLSAITRRANLARRARESGAFFARTFR